MMGDEVEDKVYYEYYGIEVVSGVQCGQGIVGCYNWVGDYESEYGVDGVVGEDKVYQFW